MSYLCEDLERGVESLLKSQITAQLAAAETRWASTPVTLPAPVTWERGYRSDILERASTYFPLIVTMFPIRQPQQRNPDQRGPQAIIASGSVSAFIVADTEGDANSIAHRYGEALVAGVQAQRIVAGHRLAQFEPATRIYADTGPHIKNGLTGDAYTGTSGEDYDFMKLVELTLEYEVL